jgi:hypothetical protein
MSKTIEDSKLSSVVALTTTDGASSPKLASNPYAGNSIHLGPISYLIQVELEMYEMLTKNMEMFNDLASNSGKVALDSAIVSANATRDSIQKDADKEREMGALGIAGSSAILAGPGLKTFRTFKPTDGQMRIKTLDTRIDNIRSDQGEIRSGTVGGSRVVTTDPDSPYKQGSKAHQEALDEFVHGKKDADGNRIAGTSLKERKFDGIHDRLTDHEKKLIIASGDESLKSRVVNKLEHRVMKLTDERTREKAAVDHGETIAHQAGQAAQSMADSTGKVVAAGIDEDKKRMEFDRVISQANQEAQRNTQQQTQESRSEAAREQQSVLDKMREFDHNNKVGV